MPRARYRLLMWLDEATNVDQVALAQYLGEVKLHETTWTPEPFTAPSDGLAELLARLNVQERLL